MILRPLVSTLDPSRTAIEPIWIAVERSQRQDFSAGCWLVPQPAHAAVAGDIAAKLDPQAFPGITPEIVRAIALHDSGWSPDDAVAIQESRAKGAKVTPLSFIAAPMKDVVAAWTGSIDIAGKALPLGGYLVSRHFVSIAENYRSKLETKPAQLLTSFIKLEQTRQQRLRKKLPHDESHLDRLLEALQFSDLLSLYLSCGLEGDAEFPQKVEGKTMQLRRKGGDAAFSPNPFVGECSFSIAALRHPRTSRESSQAFHLVVRG